MEQSCPSPKNSENCEHKNPHLQEQNIGKIKAEDIEITVPAPEIFCNKQKENQKTQKDEIVQLQDFEIQDYETKIVNSPHVCQQAQPQSQMQIENVEQNMSNNKTEDLNEKSQEKENQVVEEKQENIQKEEFLEIMKEQQEKEQQQIQEQIQQMRKNERAKYQLAIFITCLLLVFTAAFAITQYILSNNLVDQIEKIERVVKPNQSVKDYKDGLDMLKIFDLITLVTALVFVFYNCMCHSFNLLKLENPQDYIISIETKQQKWRKLGNRGLINASIILLGLCVTGGIIGHWVLSMIFVIKDHDITDQVYKVIVSTDLDEYKILYNFSIFVCCWPGAYIIIEIITLIILNSVYKKTRQTQLTELQIVKYGGADNIADDQKMELNN